MTSRRNYEMDGAMEMAGYMDHLEVTVSDNDPETRLELGKVHRKMDIHAKFLGEDASAQDAPRDKSACPSDADMTEI